MAILIVVQEMHIVLIFSRVKYESRQAQISNIPFLYSPKGLCKLCDSLIKMYLSFLKGCDLFIKRNIFRMYQKLPLLRKTHLKLSCIFACEWYAISVHFIIISIMLPVIFRNLTKRVSLQVRVMKSSIFLTVQGVQSSPPGSQAPLLCMWDFQNSWKVNIVFQPCHLSETYS